MTTPLAGGFFQADFLGTVGSTSEELRVLAEAGASEGCMVVAEQQDRGRGRSGRQWVSPAGNLYVSFLLRPDRGAAEAAQLSFLVAVALAEALESSSPAGIDFRLKWPNDVLANGRKIAGILLESALAGDRVAWVIAGVGVNLASHPEDTRWPATDLAALGRRAEPREVLETFAAAFPPRYRQWLRDGFAPLREAWLARAAGLGGSIEVKLGSETLSGRFDDLDASGALALVLAGGGRRLIAAGEIQFPAVAA